MQQDIPVPAQAQNRHLWRSVEIIGLTICLAALGLAWPSVGSLALPLAATLLYMNQWRMGHKVNTTQWILVMSVGVFALQWLIIPHVRNLDPGMALDNAGISMVLSIITPILAVLCLTRGADRPIEDFIKSEAQKRKAHPLWGMGFFLSVVLSSYLIGRGADALSGRFLGSCYFLTLPDLLQNWQDEHRQGIDFASLRAEDLGCGWAFRYRRDAASDESLAGNLLADFSRTLVFRYSSQAMGVSGATLIQHRLWLETSSRGLEEIRSSYVPDGKVMRAPELSVPPDYIKIMCATFEGPGRDCLATVIRGPAVSQFRVISEDLPEDELLNLIGMFVAGTDKRVQQYLAGQRSAGSSILLSPSPPIICSSRQ